MPFVQKSVNAEGGLGADLRELRERCGLSVEEISRKTKVIPSQIRAWENNQWESSEDVIYLEKLFRSYVSALGGTGSYFLDKYRGALAERGVTAQREDYLPRVRNIPRFDMAVGARIKTLAIFGGFVALLVGYVFFQVYAISIPPPLEVFQPADGQRIDNPRLHVQGRTGVNASVTINERPAIVQRDGTFALEIDVPRGTTLVVVSAKKRYGKEVEVVRRVVYERPILEE
ncbi:MAG: helix-turn-helix domain-containing protein [Patescibacteria group bacterium]